MPKFYITTPIYYINAEPHIGHTYTTIVADAIARFHRMNGDQTFFLTGTDEHGEKNEQKALERGMDPQAYADEMSATFQMAWDRLNIGHDRFLRTTEPSHKAAVTRALQTLFDKGWIYKGEHRGLYCVGCEQYKTDKDLVNGKCPDHLVPPVERSEESYIFKLSAFQNQLKDLITSDSLAIRPVEKKKEILSFLEQGLNDISFSRKNIRWGVPLPWDPEHVAYVWPDALLNYLTGLGWEGESGVAPEMWPADVQLMSKDILRVHATIWPAMLLALDLPVPKSLFIHGFFLVDGQKMSKSIGNVISPGALMEKYGVDATRYLLLSATSFGSDGDIGWARFDERYASDLANDFGNLVHRVLSMTEKYFEGSVPEGKGEPIADVTDGYRRAFDELALHDALGAVSVLVRASNQFIEEQKPWQLAKTDPQTLASVMYRLLESLRLIAWMTYPFMPQTAEVLLGKLGLDPVKEMQRPFADGIVWAQLHPGAKISKGDPLFPRLEVVTP